MARNRLNEITMEQYLGFSAVILITPGYVIEALIGMEDK